MAIEILDPRAVGVVAETSTGSTLSGLRGRKVALFSNNKPNVDHLYNRLRELLKEVHGVSDVILCGKSRASRAATEEELAPALENADLTIVAIGD